MNRAFHLRALWIFLLVLCPVWLVAQSDGPVSLGDLARSVRRSKAPAPAPLVIDNDNLSKVMDEVESHRMDIKALSPPPRKREFALNSPDGDCSLSFNATTATTLSVPFVAEDVPPTELAKLEGPAIIEGDSLEVSMYNGSDWKLTEITVGLTLVRRPPAPEAVYFGSARLMPALAEDPQPSEKPSELTLLFHLKGPVVPLATSVFHEKLGAPLAADQEWHWAILGAKGIAPAPDPQPLPATPQPPPN
ncbi:MAG: hypothetical protein ACRD3L_03880 [Terriglobales bacterium]